MKIARRFFVTAALAAGVAACTHSDYMPNVIQLSPNGSQTSPARKSIASSFTLSAIEDGYTSEFTADTIKGSCWVVQSPVTTGGAWTVVPQGSACTKLEVDQIQVKDMKGNSASTFIKAVQ